MSAVRYEITRTSNTGKYGKNVENIRQTEQSSIWEVDVSFVQLEVTCEPCVLSTIALTVMTPMRITVELKTKDTSISKDTKEVKVISNPGFHTAVFEFNKPEKTAKVTFTLTRAIPDQPIRVVSLVLMSGPPQSPVSVKPSVYDTPPMKRGSDTVSPDTEKYRHVTRSGGDGGQGKTGIRHPTLSVSSPTEHIKLRDQPITHPYSKALAGLRLTSFSDSPMTEVIQGLVSVMGGSYTPYCEPGVHYLIVDLAKKRDSRVILQAERQGVKPVKLDWLVACRDANQEQDYREYLLG